jgi:hypothetical protein
MSEICVLRFSIESAWPGSRVSVRGEKSLGGHFACLCRGFDLYELKKNIIIIFQKEKGNTFTLLIIILVKSSKIAQITYYDPQSAGINLRSTQSDLTPRRLTLPGRHPTFKTLSLGIGLNSISLSTLITVLLISNFSNVFFKY